VVWEKSTMTVVDQGLPGLTLPHSDVTAIDMLTAHALSEPSNDVDLIMPTVSSWDQFFTSMIDPTPDGDLEFRYAFGPEESRQWYVDATATFPANGIDRRRYGLRSNWWMLNDTYCEVRDAANGDKVVPLDVVILIPTWSDGIIGEICYHRPPWVVPLTVVPDQALTAQLNAFDDTWRSGDLDARLAMVEEKTCSAIRIIDVNGQGRQRVVARTKDELRSAWGAPEAGRVLELERSYHVSTDFYVLGVYKMLLEVADGRVLRETVRILPLGPHGNYRGEFSYSMESRTAES
jgi:hypothetical protein